MSGPLISFEDIDFAYPARRKSGVGEPSLTLSQVSLKVGAGECVGVIGESGSGKSTLALLATGLLAPKSGLIRIGGEVANDPARRPSAQRRAVQLVFQDPYGSLDPTFTVADIVSEGLVIHRLGDAGQRRATAAAALKDVGLGPEFLTRRPHELSGGQRQRVAIARALAVGPELLILDEPTSALDLLVQAQILNLLLDLQSTRGLAFLLITHDLDVVGHLAHRVYVMHQGRIVESGEAGVVLARPHDPYTRRLVAAAPAIGSPA